MAATADEPKLRIRIVPIVLTIVLGLGLPVLAAVMALAAARILPFLPRGAQPLLPWLYSQHAFQLLLALVAIAVIKRFVPADYGLHRPRGKTYIPEAILWGIAFGIIMTLIDYAPQIIARVAPPLDYPLTANNMVGWLAFEGIYVGPTEEIPFRALLVTFLAAKMPGKIRIGRYRMNAAGVIGALILPWRTYPRSGRGHFGWQAGSSSMPLCWACYTPIGSKNRKASWRRSSVTISAM